MTNAQKQGWKRHSANGLSSLGTFWALFRTLRHWALVICLRHPFPSTQSPLRNKTRQREQENTGSVPQWKTPTFCNGRVTIRQAADKRLQLDGRHHFARALFGDRFEQSTVRFQRAKFFRGRIGSPAGFGSAHLGADRVRDR